MAVRSFSTEVDTVKEKVIKWTGLLNGDTGQPYPYAGKYPIKSVQVYGTFGAGPHCYIEGCNQDTPVDYHTLNDMGGAALDIVAAGFKGIRENSHWVRPRTTGDGATNLTVMLCIGK